MKNELKQFALLISFILTMGMNVPSAFAINNPRNTYEVKGGDFLWKIATTYRTTVQDLKINKRVTIRHAIRRPENQGPNYVSGRSR